jgi:hypothetical protein
MTKKRETDDKVGYQKPPIERRFRKGKSGNPKGRPRKIAEEFDPGRILQAIDNEEIIVQVNGKNKRMRKSEIFFRHLFQKALGGNLTAAKLIFETAVKYSGPDAEGPPDTRFVVMPDEYWDRRYPATNTERKT